MRWQYATEENGASGRELSLTLTDSGWHEGAAGYTQISGGTVLSFWRGPYSIVDLILADFASYSYVVIGDSLLHTRQLNRRRA